MARQKELRPWQSILSNDACGADPADPSRHSRKRNHVSIPQEERLMNENYIKFKLTIGAIATVGLYSVLYRENKFYRFFEHMFLGLAAGFMMVALWTETMKEGWWDKMVGAAGE